jgi:hypothetical protein
MNGYMGSRLLNNVGLGAFLACLIGVAAMSQNVYLSLVSALLCIATILYRPVLGLVFAVLLYSTQLIQLLAGVPGLVFRAAPFVLLVTSCIGLFLTKRIYTQKKFSLVTLILPLGFIPAAFLNLDQSDIFGLLIAGSTYAIPFLGFFIGSRLRPEDMKLVQLALVAALFSNFVTALWQFLSGVDAFLAVGLGYGTSVRTIDGAVRAPGLMITNSELGLFAGVVALYAIVQIILKRSQSNRFFILTSIFLSFGCLILSTSRSGSLIVLVGLVGALLFTSNSKQSLKSVVGSNILFFTLLVGGFVMTGAVSNSSWAERLERWRTLASGDLSIFGSGFGSVGAATFSEYSSRPPAFTDNIYLSVLIQFGFLGLTALIVFIWSNLRKGDSQMSEPISYGYIQKKIFIFSLAITGALVEVIDYPLAMLCAAVFIGSGMNSQRNLEPHNSNKKAAVSETA